RFPGVRKMKRTYLAAAAALSMAGSAHAQMQMPQFSGPYGELGYSWMKVDGLGTTGRPAMLRGILGIGFHPNFAAEALLGGGVVDDDRNVNVNGNTVNANFKVKSVFGLYLKPRYLSNQFEVYGRLGWAQTKVDVEARPSGLTDNVSENDFSWGLGANYYFN